MIGIIDYGAGNLFSLQCALDRLALAYRIVKEEVSFDQCDQFIIPGVGHARPSMDRLIASGLEESIRTTDRPVLGICLGMQLLCTFSEEGDTPLLGAIPLDVQRFKNVHKVPHMGWNRVSGEGENEYFYFVHSYFVEADDRFTSGICEYGKPFSAIVRFKNFCGVQFHPEKSGRAGLRLLERLLA